MNIDEQLSIIVRNGNPGAMVNFLLANKGNLTQSHITQIQTIVATNAGGQTPDESSGHFAS